MMIKYLLLILVLLTGCTVTQHATFISAETVAATPVSHDWLIVGLICAVYVAALVIYLIIKYLQSGKKFSDFMDDIFFN